MANQPNATFTFTLDSFQITDTRSLHEDTDYVTFTLLVKGADGAGAPNTLKKSMGDVNNGTHTVNLSFPNVVIRPTDTVTLNYLIVNSGHSNPGSIETTIEGAANKLAVAGGTLLGNAIIPGLGSALGAAAGWLAGQLVGVLTANCDGVVAAEQDTFTYNDLIAKAAHGPFSQATRHPGTNSPTGCGRNSAYVVNWHMLQVGSSANKVVPNVLQMPATQAATAVQHAGLVAKFTGTNGAGSFVFSQAPSAGNVVGTGSAVTMTLHAGPAK